MSVKGATVLSQLNGVSNHQPHDCLLNRLFRHRSKKTSNLPITGLCEGNSPVTGEFPTQRASNVENVSIWWRHYEMQMYFCASAKWFNMQGVKSLWPSDAIWWHSSRSTLAQVMAALAQAITGSGNSLVLTAPSHNLNQGWLIIKDGLWHLALSNFIKKCS